VIGLGFAGVGWLGESLIKELPKLPQLGLAAVQDARVDLAAHIAERYGSPWYGSSFEDMVRLPTVDAVVICTPNALHVPQAGLALAAGKHVLVQKPLALSYADAEAVIAEAAKRERLLFVDYTYRFLATMDAFRKSLGTVRTAKAKFHNIYGPGAEKTWFFDPKLSGGGALMDLGVHLLDLALWLVQPRSVQLVDCWLDQRPLEHAARLELRLDDVPFELEVSWNAARPLTEISFEIDGVRWENVDGSFFHFRTVHAGRVLLQRETTLREDTLRAFCTAMSSNTAPSIDPRVYALLDQAYCSA
jgi:predicted dehydrogenase